MKKALLSIIAIIMGGFLVLSPVALSTPAFADDDPKCVDTAILGEGGRVCDDGKGGAVEKILQNVVNFLSVGVGVLGVIGVTVVGIQYLTAGGNEEQTRKAKRRLLEIVIGLAAYFLMYGILNWLGVVNK